MSSIIRRLQKIGDEIDSQADVYAEQGQSNRTVHYSQAGTLIAMAISELEDA